MLNHLKFKQNRHELQVNLHYYYHLCALLYQQYCPRCVTERRNVEHAKLDDAKLLALLCLQTSLDIQSQRRFYRLMTAFMPQQIIISRSRFNHRAHQLLPVVNALRVGMTRIMHSRDKQRSLIVCLIHYALQFVILGHVYLLDKRILVITPLRKCHFMDLKLIWS